MVKTIVSHNGNDLQRWTKVPHWADDERNNLGAFGERSSGRSPQVRTSKEAAGASLGSGKHTKVRPIMMFDRLLMCVRTSKEDMTAFHASSTSALAYPTVEQG